MSDFKLAFEVASVANKIAREMLRVKSGEKVLLVGDSQSDWNLIKATSVAVNMAGGDGIIILMEARAMVNTEPPGPVAAALKAADVVCDFAKVYLIHTRTYSEALSKGVRILCLPGLDTEMSIRCLARVNFQAMIKLGDKLAEVTKRAKTMRIVSPSGTDVTFRNAPKKVFHTTGILESRGSLYDLPLSEVNYLGGQVAWIPEEESINGRLAIDGSIWPPDSLGLLKNPIQLKIVKGRIVDVNGGGEAKIFSSWMESFRDRAVFNVAHVCYGLNPGAKLSGNVLEDERVYGVSQWGFGSQAAIFGGRGRPSRIHTDAIIMNPSIWTDGELIEKDGEFTGPALGHLSRELRRISQ